MSRCLGCSFWIWLALLAGAATAAAPEIGYVSRSAPNFSPVQIFGEGFAEGKVEFYTWSPQEKLSPTEMIQRIDDPAFTPPAAPPQELRPMSVLSLTPQVATVVLYGGGYPGGMKAPQAVWARGQGGCSKPYVVNRPQLFFLERPTAAPGDELRVFGRDMVSDPHGHWGGVFLRDKASGKAVEARWGKRFDRQNHFNYQLNFEIWLQVPPDLPEGDHEVWVHCGASGWLGWCEKPLVLSVRKAIVQTPKTFSIKDFGAVGDGVADDTRPIQKALEAARAAGGGWVLVPAGVYAIRSPLFVPPGVRLKGVRWQLSSIRVVEHLPFSGDFLDQDWEGYAKDFLPHVRRLKPLPLLYVCSDSAVSDLELIGGPATAYVLTSFAEKGEFHDFTVTRCRLVNPGSPIYTTTPEYQPGRSCFASGNPWRRIHITHNLMRAMGGCGTWGEMSECVVAFNDFEPEGGPYGTTGFCTLSGWHNIIEGNVIRNSNRGFTAGPWSQKNQGESFIARNRVEDGGYNKGAAESYLIEYGAGGHDGWLGRVADAGPDWFEASYGSAGRHLDTPPLPPEAFAAQPPNDARAALKPDAHEGLFAIVFKGKGLGQFRRVAANTDRRVTLDAPWRILPDATSWIVIRRCYYNSVFLNNLSRDTLGSLEFWGGMLENIVYRHQAWRTAPLHCMTHGEPAVMHNRFEACQLHDASFGLWELHHYGGGWKAPTLLGNVFFGNELQGGSVLLVRRAYGKRGYVSLDDPEVVADGAGIAWNVFGGNDIVPQPDRYAIHVGDPGCEANVFWRNTYPLERVLDKGKGTVWTDNLDGLRSHFKDAFEYDLRAYQRGEAK